MGYALGVMGMSRRQFMALRPCEYDAAVRMHERERERTQRDAWERMRLLASIVIAPHLTRKIAPAELLPLPWDKTDTAATMTAEQRKNEFLKTLELSKKYHQKANGSEQGV